MAAGRSEEGEGQEVDSDEEPFFGFSNADIPRPIEIKTEPVEENGDDECMVVKVTRAEVPLPQVLVKKEVEDEDDLDIFHGWSLQDLPRPILIKEEVVEDASDEDMVTASRAAEAVIPDYFVKDPAPPLGDLGPPLVPGDELCDEFDEAQHVTGDVITQHVTGDVITQHVTGDVITQHMTADVISQEQVVQVQEHMVQVQENMVHVQEQVVQVQEQFVQMKGQVVLSPEKEKGYQQEQEAAVMGSPQRPVQKLVFNQGQEIQVSPQAFTMSGEDGQVTLVTQEEEQEEQEQQDHLQHNSIQIIDQNGQKIVILNRGEGELSESDLDTDNEDREFTVIVEEEEDLEEEEGDNRDIHIDENNVIEAESIEDILAQFESESAPRSVACPNCRKCFVSAHFLNLHISNNSTMCDLCNTQCCSQVNLRNHKNLECDLSKRKRNIDLIAQETAILGRKPIEPEKYYNLPIESDEETGEEGDSPGPSPAKKLRSINDAKYECGECGRYVKILDSHMKFVHGQAGGGRGAKYRCPQCSVLVTDLQSHVERRHGEHAERVVVVGPGEEEEGGVGEIVRCRHPGCDLFFNNNEEVSEHIRREHTDEMRLACGMGGCDEVFDNRGALKRHRTDSHPELEEFKPVDLENDDPDRAQDLSVACPVCERKFKHKNTCTVHIKTNHLGWTKRKLFECPDCFRSFDNKRSVDCHREAVHLGIRTVCPLCDKPVTRLDLHVRMVHTELPEWPCPDCGKKFKRKFDLNRHRVTVHLGVRNFPCDLCGKRFADMKDMTRHKNAVHYGMKIKWNSRKVKGEGRSRGHKVGQGQRLRREQREMSSSSAEVKLEDGSQVSIPVEYIETVETTEDGQEIHISHGGGDLEGSTVILDPVLQSQLAAVQGGPGEPRVLIEADPENSGGLRFVVIQDEEGASVLEEGGETVEVR